MSKLENQTTFGLIFEKFLKSKPGIVGIIMLIVLAILSIFYEFFSPNDPNKVDFDFIYVPPSKVYFFD